MLFIIFMLFIIIIVLFIILFIIIILFIVIMLFIIIVLFIIMLLLYVLCNLKHDVISMIWYCDKGENHGYIWKLYFSKLAQTS